MATTVYRKGAELSARPWPESTGTRRGRKIWTVPSQTRTRPQLYHLTTAIECDCKRWVRGRSICSHVVAVRTREEAERRVVRRSRFADIFGEE